MDPLGSVVECIIVLVLILLNGLLSMLEMAVVSSRKSVWNSWRKKAAKVLLISANWQRSRLYFYLPCR